MTMLDHPYHFDTQGRSARTGHAEHVRDLIEQLLFTAPGERVMRPDFGVGLSALLFEPNAQALAGTAQFLVEAGLQRHLSHLIRVEEVEVQALDAVLQLRLRYVLLADGSTQQAVFTPPGN